LNESRRFAQLTGILTDEVKAICDIMLKNGAAAATQNMIGDAAHCIVSNHRVDDLERILKKEFPNFTTNVCDFYEGGAKVRQF